MDAADLRVFEAVARLGGMSRAAEELHTVQSNVTTRVRKLEEQLGTSLFRRHARGVDLTPDAARAVDARHLHFTEVGNTLGPFTGASVRTWLKSMSDEFAPVSSWLP